MVTLLAAHLSHRVFNTIFTTCQSCDTKTLCLTYFGPLAFFQKTYPKRIEMGSGILAIVSGGSNLMNVEPVKA